jgi:uncharacterized membrane protein
MIGLGVLALIFGDFALVWQPVPEWVPGRTALAYGAGLIMLLGGIGLLFRSTAVLAIRILFPYLIAWVLLKVPALLVTTQSEEAWLGEGELAVLLAGGWVLFVRLAGIGENSIRIARVLFAVSLIPIGLSHFIYREATAELVPAWLPFRTGWAYLTGAGQMACGVRVLFSIYPRVAAWAEAGMLSSFTLLVWVPAILAEPAKRLPWTAFFISWAITSGAWLVASNTTDRSLWSRLP